jgi:hypothetical protein
LQPFGNGYLQEFKAFALPFQKLEKELGLQRERQRDPGLFQVPCAFTYVKKLGCGQRDFNEFVPMSQVHLAGLVAHILSCMYIKRL